MSWLAECIAGQVTVRHGEMVESWPDGFFEGAWSGTFGMKDYAGAATVAGSGATRSHGGVLFVTPSHTLEGIFYHSERSRFTASNSLAFLLEWLGAEVHYDPHVGRSFASAALGIKDYVRRILSTDKGPVSRVLFENLHCSPSGIITFLAKSDPFSFPDFKAYRNTLSSEMQTLFSNAADPARNQRFSPLTTCSSGYDSTASLVLASELGCDQAVTLTRSRGDMHDSGAEIAARLRVRLHSFERMTTAEGAYLHEFLASGMGGEDIIYSCFEKVASGSVLLTGFHGDKIWSKHEEPNDVASRGDVSGSSMGELRLRAGFIHLPVPFIGVRHHSEIAAISNSAEMASFSIGGWYDRPIPRRIAEEVGIPRSAFGMEKKAASLMLFLARHLQPAHLRRHTDEQLQYLPWMERLSVKFRDRLFVPRLAVSRLAAKACKAGGVLRPAARVVRDLAGGDPRLLEHDSPMNFFDFKAALQPLRARYALPPSTPIAELVLRSSGLASGSNPSGMVHAVVQPPEAIGRVV